MKRFFQFIEQTTGEKWDYMKKPKSVAVDDYGRTIDIPKIEVEPKEVSGTGQKTTSNSMRKNISRLQNAPKGTEDRAEYKMRKEFQPPDEINMLPRRVGPSTDPEKEQNSTVDHQVLKKDTQDQMPEVNVDEPRPKIKRRM